MKNIVILSTLLFMFACKNSSNGLVEVTLELKDAPAQMIYLKNLDGKNQPLTVDSINYQGKGNIILRTKVIEPSFFQIIFGNGRDGKFLPIISSGENISIKGNYADLKKVEISGSENTKSIYSFLQKVEEQNKSIGELSNQLDAIALDKKQDSLKNALKTKMDDLTKNAYNDKVNYSRNATSPINAVLGLQTLGSMQELATVKPLMDSLNKKFTNAAYFKNAYESYNSLFAKKETPKDPTTTVQNVTAAKEISLPDVNGKIVSLSSFKGKYVLIDFWASWCGPCRGENPNVVAAYQKFKNKNFTILGVSLDKDKNAWTKAIADDKLTWTQISDLKYWQCQAAQDYGIQSIPANYLVDPSGNIIANDLRGADLHTTLEEVLK